MTPSYGRQCCVFLVLHGCSTGPWSKLFCVLAFPTTTRLPPSSTVLLALLLAYLQLSSIRWPYITFKLPRSNIDTPQRLRNLFRFPATGMCHFLPVHHLEWHFLARSKGQNITFVSQNPIKVCSSHFPGMILGCAYTTCSNNQIFCTFSRGSPSQICRFYS